MVEHGPKLIHIFSVLKFSLISRDTWWLSDSHCLYYIFDLHKTHLLILIWACSEHLYIENYPDSFMSFSINTVVGTVLRKFSNLYKFKWHNTKLEARFQNFTAKMARCNRYTNIFLTRVFRFWKFFSGFYLSSQFWSLKKKIKTRYHSSFFLYNLLFYYSLSLIFSFGYFLRHSVKTSVSKWIHCLV